jgi:DNA end-binding protein Ku
LKELPKPLENELQLAMEIVKSLSGDLDFNAYKDEYRERIEALVRSKVEGVVVVPETKMAKPAAKSLMEALRMTAESLK